MAIVRTGAWNPGGGQSIEIVPCTGVIALVTATSTTPALVELATGFAWTPIYCTPGTLGYDLDEMLTDDGLIWNHSIAGFTPDDSQSRSLEFARLAYYRQHLVRFRDNRPGVIRLIGSPVEGLTFTYKFATGEDVPGDRGYTFRLTGPTTTLISYE